MKPIETLFVVDAMQGQDAVNTARAFRDALPLTGVILTKLDGDSRGGAALSVRHVTGAPIKFAGVSEKIDGLEVFHPERMASRILGMGDVLSLLEDAQKNVDLVEAEKLAKKVKSGKGFDLTDFRAQIGQMRKMGGIAGMIDKLPAELARAAQSASVDEKRIGRLEGIINSMTPLERAKPELLKASRKRRIAAGAGVSVQEVNQLLNQFEQTQKMMKMVAKGGMQKMMRGMKGMLPGRALGRRWPRLNSTKTMGCRVCPLRRRLPERGRSEPGPRQPATESCAKALNQRIIFGFPQQTYIREQMPW